MQEEINQGKKKHPRAQVQLHHQLFPFTPSTTTAMSYSAKSQLLAVGRENGKIEVYRNRSFCFYASYCSISSVVRDIVWLNENSFVAIYLSGQLSIFSLNQAVPIKSCQVQEETNIYGAAATSDEDATILFLGCSSGTIRVYRIEDSAVHLISQSTSLDIEDHCLSLCYSHSFLYAAYLNGTIRVFQFNNNNILPKTSFHINMHQQKTKQEIVPWKITILVDLLLVGTSDGHILAYETKFFTQIQKIQTHMATILTIKSLKQNSYVSGVDSKIIQLQYKDGSLFVSGDVRGQSNDVNCLEILDNGEKYKLISSGINTDLCFYHLDENATLEPEKHSLFRLNSVPQPSDFSNGYQDAAIILAINKSSSIDIVHLSETDTQITYLSQIQLNTPANFLLLSQEANFLLYSQQDKSKLIQLQYQGQFAISTIAQLPFIKNALFSKNEQQLYFLNSHDQLISYNIYKQTQNFVIQMPAGSPSLFHWMNRLNLLITYPHQQKFYQVKLEQTEIDYEEVDCTMPDKTVSNIQFIPGKHLNALVTFTNQKFITYVQAKTQETAQWRVSKYSKQFFLKTPMSLLKIKEPIKGVINDGKDEKKMLLFSKYIIHHLIRIHMRGKPPLEFTEFKLKDQAIEQKQSKRKQAQQDVLNQELHFDQNYSASFIDNLILAIVPSRSDRTFFLLEWDKEASFKQTPNPFNAKKYKK